MIQKLRTLFTEIVAELKKVTWPQGKEVYGTTIVVIVSVFFFGFYLYIVDIIFSHVIRFIQVHVY